MRVFFASIRPLNLLVIIITMVFMEYLVIDSLLFKLNELMEKSYTLQLSTLQFVLLVLSVVCIAAGGYVLNDQMDVKADKVNHKDKETLDAKTASIAYYSLTLSGLGIALFISYQLGIVNLTVMHLIAAVSLWFYSNQFKGMPLTGNLITAMVIALVPITVGIFEVTQLQINYASDFEAYKNFNFNFIAYWVLSFGVFIFLFTLARELVKDLEDMDGDRAAGYNTLPIATSIKTTKILAIFCYVIIIGLAYYFSNYIVVDNYSFGFSLLLIALVLWLMFGLWRAQEKKDFSKESLKIKVVSFYGLLYALVVYILMHTNEFTSV